MGPGGGTELSITKYSHNNNKIDMTADTLPQHYITHLHNTRAFTEYEH